MNIFMPQRWLAANNGYGDARRYLVGDVLLMEYRTVRDSFIGLERIPWQGDDGRYRFL